MVTSQDSAWIAGSQWNAMGHLPAGSGPGRRSIAKSLGVVTSMTQPIDLASEQSLAESVPMWACTSETGSAAVGAEGQTIAILPIWTERG